MEPPHSKAGLILAFAAVYLIWGSTYLAILVALETLPPFFMAAVRFLVAGVMLYAWSRWRDGAPRPTPVQWKHAVVIGGLLLVGGNGGVVWSEQYIPSGLAALLVATVPLFMVLLDWWWGHSDRPEWGLLGGLAVGFAGVSFLVGAPGSAEGWLGVIGGIVVLLAALCWAVGSVYSRGVLDRPAPRMATAMNMLAGGAILLLLSLGLGEPGRLDVAAVSMRSMLALGYLIVFGAIVGFTAYIWLLRVSTPARVSTYAYVNPVVALFLGWGLAGEPLSGRILVGSAAVLAAVVIVTARGGLRPARGAGAQAAVAAVAPGKEHRSPNPRLEAHVTPAECAPAESRFER